MAARDCVVLGNVLFAAPAHLQHLVSRKAVPGNPVQSWSYEFGYAAHGIDVDGRTPFSDSARTDRLTLYRAIDRATPAPADPVGHCIFECEFVTGT